MDAKDIFATSVARDVQLYLELYKERPSVLVFPPVDNYKRFLIHNSIENHNDLCSFSIGQGDQRRTVICNKENLIRKPLASPDPPATTTKVFTPSRERPTTKDKRRPDRPVYVPKVRGTQQVITTTEEEESNQGATAEMPKQVAATKSKAADKPQKSKAARDDQKPKQTTTKKVEEEAADDDWDSMFADDGECLNPDVMKELTAAVQNVQIVAAPAVTSVVQEEYNDEFAHVVEVSHFPVEFKTQDLMMLLMPYKQSGFEIKWVDDTHALVIFSSAKIAGEAVANNYPGVKLKRLSEASDESKGRARRSGATMQPYKARPETCAALARRLVTGALGVKSKASKETLENERRILREAKEKKLLAKKEQKDIWDDDEEGGEAAAS